jgi:hypothetical protein
MPAALLLGGFTMLRSSKTTMETDMDAAFQISKPSDKTLGDYLTFEITDGALIIPATISRSALAEFDRSGISEIAIFEANREKICKASYEMRRVNPGLGLIALGSGNFR